MVYTNSNKSSNQVLVSDLLVKSVAALLRLVILAQSTPIFMLLRYVGIFCHYCKDRAMPSQSLASILTKIDKFQGVVLCKSTALPLSTSSLFDLWSF